MNNSTSLRAFRVSALVAFNAFAFYLFFQVNKVDPFRAVNPFAEDPYDAVGSFAVQAAMLIGMLTFARAVRLKVDPGQSPKLRLIRRGNSLVLLTILVSLAVDGIALIVQPVPASGWGAVLLAEMGAMFLLTGMCCLAFFLVFRRLRTEDPPKTLTPADAIDDLWTLIRVPARYFRKLLPSSLVGWVERFSSDRLFSRLPWMDPRRRPWRFAVFLSGFAGVGLLLAQLSEGLPPSLMAFLLIAGIFLCAEVAAILLGFALIGGYLGLRPAIRLLTRPRVRAGA